MKSAPHVPTTEQTRRQVAWIEHMKRQGIDFGYVIPLGAAVTVGNVLAEIENASAPSPDIGFDP